MEKTISKHQQDINDLVPEVTETFNRMRTAYIKQGGNQDAAERLAFITILASMKAEINDLKDAGREFVKMAQMLVDAANAIQEGEVIDKIDNWSTNLWYMEVQND